MKVYIRAAAILVALVLVSGCASTKISNDRSRIGDEKIAKPDRILIYDFAATAADLAPGSAPQAEASTTATAEQIEMGRKLGAEVAKQVAAKVRDMGLPAERAAADVVPKLGDIVMRGHFESIEEGSAVKRVVIGFGSGSADLKSVAALYQMTASGLRLLGSGSVDSAGGKSPGAVVPAAVAIATANPIGLIVMGAVKVGTEVSGRSTIEGAAERTSDAIAERLQVAFQKQGWI